MSSCSYNMFSALKYFNWKLINYCYYLRFTFVRLIIPTVKLIWRRKGVEIINSQEGSNTTSKSTSRIKSSFEYHHHSYQHCAKIYNHHTFLNIMIQNKDSCRNGELNAIGYYRYNIIYPYKRFYIENCQI